MSIENAINELTAAIREQTQALLGVQRAPVNPAVTEELRRADAKKAPTKPAAAPPKTDAKPVTRDDVSKLVVDCQKYPGGRDAVIAILEQLEAKHVKRDGSPSDVPTVTGLEKDRYAEAVTLLAAKLESLKGAE